jgi:YidC/Oxa1 family membrane protein insertase
VEKRFVTFLVLSLAFWILYPRIHMALFPRDPVEQPAGAVGEVDPGDEDGKRAEDDQVAENGQQANSPAPGDVAAEIEGDEAAIGSGDADKEAGKLEQDYTLQRWTLGTLDPESPYAMLVTANSRGGSIERVELNSPRYHDLDDHSGYLGELAPIEYDEGGCWITVVGPGTPASMAVTSAPGVNPGLHGPTYEADADGVQRETRRGDRIVSVDGQAIANPEQFALVMAETKPGQAIDIEVDRPRSDGEFDKLVFKATLVDRPLAVIRPDLRWEGADAKVEQPLSFLSTLHQIGDKQVTMGADDIKGLASLNSENWAAVPLKPEGDAGEGIEFRRQVTPAELKKLGLTGAIDIVKRYRLGKKAAPDSSNHKSDAYSLSLEIEITNRSDESRKIGYRIQGPTGLPLEGWWYSSKVHPSKWFAATGARDVVWESPKGRHELISCAKLTEQAKETPDNPNIVLVADQEVSKLGYVGCDAQYFAVAMLPPLTQAENDPYTDPSNYLMSNMAARAVGPLDLERKKRTDVTFVVDATATSVPAGESIKSRYTIYAGPKEAELLDELGLSECISYGLFGRISRPMTGLLHLFYRITRNYGIAIIMLTILVRGALFPLGRKMALNAQKMQELAPEMKKIADKYKNDLEKRTQAQRELFAKHNYNPFSGCLVMFFQVPIFIGLYRGISVDVALRQSPLIPGLQWCSNLAGPDMALHWRGVLPEFLAAPTGYLGPYLNILPLITVALFLVHQKLFTPPPTDEQQQMQQQIMKFMMLFMGVMFHKVASGLCIYFIASSIWGLAERLLLPKKKGGTDGQAADGTDPKPNAPSEAAVAERARRKKRK